jgi:ferredoxin-NADP reductase
VIGRRRSLRTAPLRLLEALATPHAVDRYLELINPMLTVRELRAAVTEVRRCTADSVTLTLRPTHQWRGFRAGQYVQLTVDIDGVRRSRCYSPCSSQYRNDGQFELTVKAHGGGLVSRWLYAQARPGLVVGLEHPQGSFVLPDQRPARVVLISGGSGITPVLSMLRTLCDEGHDGEIAFVHYSRTPDDVPLRDELEALAAVHPNVRVALAHTAADGELTGHFSAEHLDALASWWTDAEAFVCGPAALREAVRARYAEQGLESHVHSEEFVLTPVGTDAADATGTITFARAGASVENTGATLLEQAEAAGLDPEFGCRMGICFSCTKLKTSGCTRNIRTGATDSDPDTEIQLCINVPVGDVALDL